jgi:glutamyl-tRNA synthetase
VKYCERVLLEKNVSCDDKTLAEAAALIQDRVVLVNDIWEEIKVFFEAPGVYDEKSVKKVWKDNTSDVLMSVCGVFEGGAIKEAHDIKRALIGVAEQHKIGLWGVMAPLRLCLVGSLKGPDLMMLIKLIGTNTAAERIRHALASL